MIGAMASKKASASSPVSLAIASASAGEVSGPVGRGRAQRTHLVEHDRHAARGDLPSRLGSGKPAADDVHWVQTVFGHGTRLSRPVFGVANGGWRNAEPVGVEMRARLLRLKAKAPARCGRLWR